MTTANMKLVVLGVTFPDKLELSEAKLDEGEHITKRVVELRKLFDELQEYDKKVGCCPVSRGLSVHVLTLYRDTP